MAAILSTMRKFSLTAIAREQAERAATGSAGRGAATVVGGHEQVLRQTVIALNEGASLSEHANPGEATVTVLYGRVRLDADGDSWEGRDLDLIEVPPKRHSLHALTDCAVLLTVAKRDEQRRPAGRS